MNAQEIVTEDLSEFGYREKAMAGELLTAYKGAHDKARFLGDGVKVAFNRHSGCVFLTDEDYNTAMMNGDNLEDWFTCPECGHEGFLEDMPHDGNEECKRYLREIRI